MRQQDDDKKQRVKDAVKEVILQEGFGGASIAKIAKHAGVSPATVYIYYENKEDMMNSIFAEFASNMWAAVLCGVDENASGSEIVNKLLHNYYNYMTENATVFSFVEQFASCPALAKNFSGQEYASDVLSLIETLKNKQVLKAYNSISLFAMLFFPVKALAAGSVAFEQNADSLLEELIHATQDAVLRS